LTKVDKKDEKKRLKEAIIRDRNLQIVKEHPEINHDRKKKVLRVRIVE